VLPGDLQNRLTRSTIRCKRLALAVVAAYFLVASGAATAAPDQFTASVTPSAVKPSTTTTYQVKVTNSQTSQEADRARIGIPLGFTVDPGSISATTTSAPGCTASTWEPDGVLVAEGRINLRSPPGGGDHRLCPSATLTVSFIATSPAGQGVYTWVTELLRGETVFTPPDPQPEVVVDGTPPTVAIGQAPSSPSGSRSATFTFSASEPTHCKLDTGAFAACTGSATYTNLSDGPHTFTVQATDAAGNTAQDSHTWTVETGAPTAAVASGPARLTNSRSATFVFAANEPSSFRCQLDGGSFLPCTSPASFQGLADGAHTFVVRPTDSVGNTGAVASYAWRIDATAPQTTLGARPRSLTALLSASFTFSASEQATFQCKLDAGAFAACTSPRTYRRLRRTGHTFQVRSVDAAGNVDPTPAVLRWTIVAVVRTTKATSALLAPRSGAHVTSAPLLAWRRVPRASYYNVQLFRGGTKVLSAWPTRTRLQLRQRWTFLGRTQQLAPGRYRWYVWPRLGRGAKARYGTLLGQSTFTVTRR
jgi:hypothetical protein